MTSDALKQCPKCEGVKPHTEFSRRKSRPNCLAGWCKSCEKKRMCRQRATPEGYAASREAIDRWRTTTYTTWRSMFQRCYNPNANNYARYGGRGIRICERWSKFAAFIKDMGKRPNNKTIDRVDNNGNYEPENCQWATAKEQRANRRKQMTVRPKGP